MKKALLCSLTALLLYVLAAGQNTAAVNLNWLETVKPAQATGVSWGVPFAKGTVKKNQSFLLTAADGSMLPLQSWPLAYWPDGSVKWSGFATVATGKQTGFKLTPGSRANADAQTLQVNETSSAIRIATGQMQCIVPKSGKWLIDSLVVESRTVGTQGHLECVLQNGPDGEDFESPRKEKYTSKITKTNVEQNGPVRTVVRVQGMMQAERGGRSWLPFNIRLYFYAGSKAVRMVNTITYDGDDQKDFIKGLGLVLSVPLHEQVHNRHIRFGGEGEGVWTEPVQPLVGRFTMQGAQNLYAEQMAGKPVQNKEQFAPRMQALINDLPSWNDYRLMQVSADGFSIQKRTNTSSTWLDVIAGKRAKGFVFAGDTKGGLAVGLKDFWQSYPAALEVRHATTGSAELRVWMWSPYGEAMDMRHYDTVAHGLDATYEDVQPGFSTPYGIARTSELTLFASSGVPSNEELSNEAAMASHPPILVTPAQYLHTVNVFGAWSLPDRSSAGKRWIEDQLDKAVNFYQKEIDQRNWYGFWNYGDVMHTYDGTRHSWRYDIGGYAWDNTELSTDMWLWYTYLRSGRPDIFRMAEAMTRHTSEVDVYHTGKFAGLGSRHNVRHWGCGSKEVRESQAAYRRFYYYLTTDERTGDIMHEVAETADKTMADFDPLRLILPKTQYPTHARIGPDWLALVSNWMTEWERTGDKKWRDKIMAGVASYDKMPYGFYSGAQAAFGYDPATNKMYQLNDTIGSSHLSILMGGPEIAYELTDLLQDKTWNKLWLQFASLYAASQDEVKKAFNKTGSVGAPGPWYARMPAYTAYVTKNPQFAQRAWNEFLMPRTQSQFDAKPVDSLLTVKLLEEVPDISTNNTAQWCLNAIQLLQLVGDQLPQEHPFWSKKP